MSVSADKPRKQNLWTRAAIWCVAGAVILGVGFASGATAMWFAMGRMGWNVNVPLVGDAATLEPANADEMPRDEAIGLLEQIWDILDAEYVEPESLDNTEMYRSAAAGLVAAVGDPHTAYVEPATASVLEEDLEGTFEGIGATVKMEEGRVIIGRPLPNSPAEAAGIQPGDVILEVDGTSLEGMGLYEVVALIRGPKGTVVRLLVEREGVDEPFIVPVTRDKVEAPIVASEMLEGTIVYLQLTEFNAQAPRLVRNELRDLLKEDPKGIILDLRNNPGGYLHVGVQVASEFLPYDTTVLYEERRDVDEPVRYAAERGGLATDLPMVVLVNGGSASAAEIVAGAIRDNDRGALIGTITYGKGSVQSTHTLSDGSGLRVTISRWQLPSGQQLMGEGIAPDIEVEMTTEDWTEGRDPQRDRAVQYLLEGR
ncbi:MAG: S41 family peptidase [Anaerolineae bacterium]